MTLENAFLLSIDFPLHLILSFSGCIVVNVKKETNAWNPWTGLYRILIGDGIFKLRFNRVCLIDRKS